MVKVVAVEVTCGLSAYLDCVAEQASDLTVHESQSPSDT